MLALLITALVAFFKSVVIPKLSYLFKLIWIPFLLPKLVTLLKFVAKGTMFGFFFLGISALGILPQSPFRLFNNLLLNSQVPIMTFVRYLSVFVPFPEILLVMQVWVGCIVVWYVAKIPLRWAKFIS